MQESICYYGIDFTLTKGFKEKRMVKLAIIRFTFSLFVTLIGAVILATTVDELGIFGNVILKKSPVLE